jgi:uncharacterized membrane protein
MSPKRKCKTCIITIILLLSSLSFFSIVSESVDAQENSAETLYFSGFNLTEYISTYEPPKMTSTLPNIDNESYFPPTIAQTEDFAFWFLYWLSFKTIDLDGLDGLGDEFDLLDLFDPLEIEQIYTFEGEEDTHIAGNMKFDLFFSTNLPIKLGFTDEIQITVSLNKVELKNTTTTIDPSFFGGKIQKQTIFIENFDFTIEGGDELSFSIKMLPGDKPIGNIIKRRDLDTILESADILADALIEQEDIPTLQELGLVIKEFVNLSSAEGINLTIDDIAELINALRASSFVFGSSLYPSSVTLPSKISDDENIKNYYLRGDGKLLEEISDDEQGIKVSLRETQNWTGLSPSRYKILKGATANLYLDYRDLIRILNLGRAKINATLLYDGEIIASSDIELEKTTILTSILQPIEPKIITFDFAEKEILNDEDLTLKVGVAEGTRFGPLDRGIYRKIDLIYDSSTYPSHLSVTFAETDHIKMEFDNNETQNIITGGSAKYILNVTSEYDDNVTIKVKTKGDSGNWSFEYPDSVQVSSDNYTIINVEISHNNPELAAYDRDFIEFNLEVGGMTGFASKEGLIRVKKEAVDFDVDVGFTPTKEIKHGERGTYTFIIENSNTGLLPDDYIITAKSQHNWSIELNESDFENVEVGDNFVVKATVFVPSYTDISEDKLTLKIESIESKKYNEGKIFEVTVTTEVILPNVLEHFYHAFENAADSLGLDEVLGDFGAAFLIFIVFFLIFIILLFIILILRRKYVEIICLDRIKEIDPESVAVFNMKVFNPSKERLTYQVFAEKLSQSEGWDISFDPVTISLDSKQSQYISLSVTPSDFVKPDDWIEIRIIARPIEKNKAGEISVVASIKPEKPNLEISGVYHWPRIFKKDSLVKTSFRVRNNGKVSANKVNIILSVNGEEKNKVEDITIPRGGYAEIEIPWIAVKGKNHLDIVII